MRDLLPPDVRRRRHVVDTLRGVFETFGFEPLVTPALEQADTILGKYGPDAERLIYRAGLAGKDDLALRYDLTVPMARVVATADVPLPFKRYQIGEVWRGERPQRGRYREFVQADVDIVGSSSILADAEVVTMAVAGLDALGLVGSVTQVNNRKVLAALGRRSGVPAPLLGGLYRAIDKRDRIGLEGVRLELRAVGLPGELLHRARQGVERYVRGQADADRLRQELEGAADEADPRVRDAGIRSYVVALDDVLTGGDVAEATEAVMRSAVDAMRAESPADSVLPEAAADDLVGMLSLTGDNEGLLEELARLLGPDAAEGLAELSGLLSALAAAGVPTGGIVVDLALVRGLDYYTGTIIETTVPGLGIGSVLGGGRYDRLVGIFGRQVPAVGTTFGVDRLVVALDDAGMLPASIDAPTAQVLVARFDEATTVEAVALASELRAAGVRVELYLDADRIGDQIRYAARRGIPSVAIVGPDEAAGGRVVVRDLRRRTEVAVARDRAAAAVGEAQAP